MLGENIKILRMEKGMSQAELAKEIGVSQGAVYFWEKGINEPTAGYLIKMSKIFSVSVDELLDFENGFTKKEPSPFAEFLSEFNKLSEEKKQLVVKLVEELSKK